ncbi:helix-turn-helix domain-containing protein [Pseudomonas aeruginosa]
MHSFREVIGARLQEERKRIGLNQDDFAQRIGVAKRTLAGYEGGNADVGAEALSAATTLGVDVLYVITGRRLPPELDSLSQTELDVVGYLREMNDDDRATFVRMAHGLSLVSKGR